MLRPEAGASHSGLKLSLHPSRIFPASPSGCPTPRVLLAGVNTFIDLLFITLATTAAVSALLLLADLWGGARR